MCNGWWVNVPVRFKCSDRCSLIPYAVRNALYRDSSPKYLHFVVIYSPSSSSKPAWMSFFCWTQTKIFWRMWETEQFWGTIDFYSIFFSYGSQWCPKIAWLQTFIKIYSSVFGRTNKFIQVWNSLRMSKWWQNFHFWVNYPFNLSISWNLT